MWLHGCIVCTMPRSFRLPLLTLNGQLYIVFAAHSYSNDWVAGGPAGVHQPETHVNIVWLASPSRECRVHSTSQYGRAQKAT